MDSGLEFEEIKLVKYRDAGMHTYTYFWSHDNKVVSPYFNSDEEAHEWMREKINSMRNKQ